MPLSLITILLLLVIVLFFLSKAPQEEIFFLKKHILSFKPQLKSFLFQENFLICFQLPSFPELPYMVDFLSGPACYEPCYLSPE